jgi:hypothetical protein
VCVCVCVVRELTTTYSTHKILLTQEPAHTQAAGRQ